MDDSDDYFNDSLILDDNALAILQQEEEKHALNVSRQPISTSVHVAKAGKKINDKQATILPVAAQNAHKKDVEDFPDIILREDGSYGVETRSPLPEVISGSSSTTIKVATSRTGTSHTATNPLSNMKRNGTPAFQAAPAKTNLQKSSTLSRNSSFQSNPPQVNTSRNYTSRNQQQQLPAQTNTGLQSRNSTTLPSKTDVPSDLEKELAYLRAQLEESNRAKLAAEQSLKEAQDIRFTKEGEVSLLRKKLEKEAKERAAEIAKLKGNVANAEAEKAKMQKDVKEEMERLRTQFIFKQHEIESTARNTLSSARSRRPPTNVPQTPVPVPPAMKTWRSHIAKSNADDVTERSPKRRRGNDDVPMKSQQINKTTAPRPAVPGYENSFFASPGKSPSARSRKAGDKKSNLSGVDVTRDKGKGKETIPPPVNVNDPRSSPSPRRGDFSSEADYGEPSPWKNADRGSSPFGDVGNTSFGMDIDFPESDEQELDDSDLFGDMDWKDLHRGALFGHCTKFATSTIRNIISDLPDAVDLNLKSMHQTACANILEYVGVRYSSAGLGDFEMKIADALVHLTYVFKSIDDMNTLLSLMDLLSSMTFLVPSFCNALLSATLTATDNPEYCIMDIICDIITERLRIQPEGEASGSQNQQSDIANAVLTLLDAICWTAPEHHVQKLSVLPLREGVLLTLIDPQQQPEVISRTVQLIIVLANYETLFRSLLSLPLSEDATSLKSDYSGIPLIEKLCAYLIEPASLKEYEETTISAILSLLSLLLNAQPDCIAIFQESKSLIPSLVYNLTQLTTMLWEDDERLIKSSALTSSNIHATNQALYLLYQLVFSGERVFNLRHKLQNESHRFYNGLSHMFIVMIGRLSYADAPDWLTAEQKTEIEQLIEPARDLLESVVEGPEVNNIWATYQDGDEEEMDVDEPT